MLKDADSYQAAARPGAVMPARSTTRTRSFQAQGERLGPIITAKAKSIGARGARRFDFEASEQLKEDDRAILQDSNRPIKR